MCIAIVRADAITYENGIANGVNGTFIDSNGFEIYRIRVNAKVIVYLQAL